MIILRKSTLDNFLYIDNHTHGAYGVNFNYANYDEIKNLLKKLYKRNIRGICPTLVGESNFNILRQLAIFKRIKEEQLKNIEDETLVIGVHLEGTFLSPKKNGIQNKRLFKKATTANFKDLVGDFEDIVKIVTIAPEEDLDLIGYLNDRNIKTQAGHTIGTTLKKCQATTHMFNAMNGIHHRNNSVALEALINDNIYCEIIADLIHCSKEIIKLLLKCKEQDKILLISDSLPSSHYSKNIVFCGKKITKEGKDDKGTIAGSNKTLDEICKKLLKEEILSKEQIEKMAFLNQIKYLDLKNKEIDILNR